MRYAQIRSMDISNGEGIGVSIFLQGCPIHCQGCFNKETWDFNGGKEWTNIIQNEFLQLISKPYVTRVSILGGEPLDYNNLPQLYDLLNMIKQKYPNKKIWLWTGFELSYSDGCGDFDQTVEICWDNGLLRNYVLGKCDYVIDGPYIESLKDLSLDFRGSSNQRVIDVKKTLLAKTLVMYKE